MRGCYKYKNFINKDPILDWFNYKKLHGDNFYKRDDDFMTFDKELLLENYTSDYKIKFCEEIRKYLGDRVHWLTNDVFIIKNKKMKNVFEEYDGTNKGSSFFTVEYSTIKVLKDGSCSSTHKWYNFKNWYYSQKCKQEYDIVNSYIIGRKYTGSIESNRFDNLALNTKEFSDIIKEADEHLQTVHLKSFEPNFNNKSDYPWHNAKKIYKNEDPPESEFYIKNELSLQVPEMSPANIYIDFELLTSVYDDFSNFPYSNDKPVVFNIGSYRDNTFTSFYIDKLDDEKMMFKKYIKYLNLIEYDTLTMFHWTGIEKRIFNQKLQEYSDIILDKNIIWFDLHEYFVKSNVEVGGCNDRKLKNICRILYKNGIIKTNWEGGLVFDGVGAMTGYLKYLKTKEQCIIDSIKEYNRVDCQVLHEIHEMLLEL